MLKIVFKPHRLALKSGSTTEQKIFALLKLLPTQEVARSRPPIALCLVVDTSGSMRVYADQKSAQNLIQKRGLRGASSRQDGGNFQGFNLKLPSLLDLAIEAAHSLVDDPRLQPDDTISVVHYDTEAKALAPQTPLSRKAEVHRAIDSLRDFSGRTRMARGLNCALEQVEKLSPQIAKRVLVFTDGATEDERDCLRLLGRFSASNTPLIGIGLGEEYKAELLTRMADATQARPYHLRKISDLSDILATEVEQTAREVVTDLRMTLSLVPGVRLESVTRVYPSLANLDTNETPCRLGNITSGDYTAFVLEFTFSGVERPETRLRAARAVLTANAPGLQQTQEFAPQDLIVEFTRDDSRFAAVDTEVIGYVQQKNVARLVDEAVRFAGKDASKAQQALQNASAMTESVGNKYMTQMLQNASDELAKTGTMSVETGKTVALGLRTRTVRTAAVDDGLDSGLAPEEIRRSSGA